MSAANTKSAVNKMSAAKSHWLALLLFAALLTGLPCTALAQAKQPNPSGQQAKQPQAEPAEDFLANVPKLDPVDPPAAEVLEKSISRGIEFLLEDQNKDGSWGSAHQTKGLNIYAPVPGSHQAFRAAVTSLCLASLIETGDQSEPVQQAIDRGQAWLLEHLPQVRRATPVAIYNVWAHGYSIQALVRLYRRSSDDTHRNQLREQIRAQFGFLERYESVNGGWGYYDFDVGSQKPGGSSISFVSGAILVAFREAADIGVEPPEKLVQRAVASIERQQKSDFAYLYGEYLKWQPARGINRPGGSLGRSQCCNLALRLWGDKEITDRVLSVWLDRLFARNGWLDMGRKRPIPHESWMQVAGYFYYFGHYYGALCIEQLPLADRPEFQAHMSLLLMSKQEKDGSWWDFPLYNYHQQYGTAFALMSLVKCRIAEPEKQR